MRLSWDLCNDCVKSYNWGGRVKQNHVGALSRRILPLALQKPQSIVGVRDRHNLWMLVESEQHLLYQLSVGLIGLQH